MSATDLIEELVHRASEHEDKLTSWEADFVSSIEDVENLTQAQLDTVKEILEKLRLPASEYHRPKQVEYDGRSRW